MSDEEYFYQIAGQVMRDTTILPVNIDITMAWMLVSGLQLATRHPEMSSHQKEQLEIIARKFQGSIVELHPEAAELLEMGWDPRHDRVRRGIQRSQRRRGGK